MSKKNIVLLFSIFLVLILACSLPTAPTDSPQALENTAIAKTVEAMPGENSNNGAVTPRPSKTPQSNAQPANSNGGVPSNRPTPTTIPTRPAPTAKANAAPTSQTLSVSNVNISPSNTVYYGGCANGETTEIYVEADILPVDQIQEVLLWADISDSTGVVHSDYVVMWELAIGGYSGYIDIGQIAPGVMVDADGSVTFWIEVVDKNNASMHSNAYSLSVWQCGGVVGPPPVAGEAEIHYFNGPANANAGDTFQLEWEVWDACKVFLDGTEVAAHSTDNFTVPNDVADGTYSFILTAWGASCDNSSEKKAELLVNVSSNGNNGNGGNNDVLFINNSSHHIVELQIDGQEVILNEAYTLLAGGGTLTVTVPAGNHTFSPGAGFWSGGNRNAMYPMPSGSFNDQDGTVTINDPSITQIMTYYRDTSYFGGSYWDSTTLHCAAFNFNSNGTFEFYIDANFNDSGTYSLVKRSPDIYAVDVLVTNSAGTESFIGTYSYSGAAAGTMYMDNGPLAAPMIEYIYNGGC